MPSLQAMASVFIYNHHPVLLKSAEHPLLANTEGKIKPKYKSKSKACIFLLLF